MPQNKDYSVISRILEVLAEFPEGLKSKRQVAMKVGGKYSTIFSYIDLLREHGFISIEDVRTESGNRPSVKVKLELLGYLYLAYRISVKSLKLATAGVIFRDAYQSLMSFLRKETQTLHNLFEDDPWNKLCFLALQKFTQEEVGSKMSAMILEEISKRIFMKYLGPEGILDIDYLDRIYKDEAEICDLILMGIKDAHKKFFISQGLTPDDLKVYLLTFGEAFDMLSEIEKRDVIIAFRYEYNNLIRHLVKSLPTEIKEDWESLMRQAGLHQIVCLFECPKCGHKGASRQDVENLIRTYTVTCGKCGGESSLAYLAKYYDKQVEETFEKYADSSGAKFMRLPLRKLYESNEDVQ
ncbi:MAG: hypothetical protein QXZ70_03405 [Candidatus Bathyarchaeia archaeon]